MYQGHGGESQSYPSYDHPPAGGGGGGGGGGGRAFNPKASVYAIDFGAQAAGKRIATTKRRIRWRWGFSSMEALEQGQTGIAARGEEHEVVLVWSVTSGKRQITMDGQEVHYSCSRGGILDFSWNIRGNHVMKVMAHASPPLSASPSFRQYDCFVDGQSFFAMPKVYELGVRGPVQAKVRVPGDVSEYQGYRGVAPNQSQDEADLQRAIQESIEESRRHLEGKSGGGGGYNESYSISGRSYAAPSPAPHDHASGADLLDIGSAYGAPDAGALVPVAADPAYGYAPTDPVYAPAPAAPGYSPATAYTPAVPALTYGSPVPALTYGSPAPQYQNPGTPNTISGHPPHPVATGQLLSPGVTSVASAPPAYGGFPVQQPLHSHDDPFAPKAPSQSEVHSALLGLYSASDQPPGTPGGAPPQPNFQSPNTHPANGQGGLSITAPLAITQEAEAAPKSEFEMALNTLVNFDDIGAQNDRDLQSAMQKRAEEAKHKTRVGNKSKGLAPVSNNVVGSGATLSQIQHIKPQTSQPDPTSIMRVAPGAFHQDGAMAGALVVHGQGPPPLQPQGFGVVHGQGYYGRRPGY